MEIADGKIVDIREDGVAVIHCRLPSLPHALDRQYSEVQVGLPDGRKLAPDQRRKAYALLGEIAAWSGIEPENVKLVTKQQFISQHLEGLEKELFSLADCDVTTAKEFISYLIDFIVAFEIPTKIPLVEYCDDIDRYIYACLTHKQCAVCGKRAELHHCEGGKIGMGNDRRQVDHIGRPCLPLCRKHHDEVDVVGEESFLAKYHLKVGAIDEKIRKLYKLGGKHEPTGS